MSRKRILYTNMFDADGVSVTQSSEDADYPMWAAYDRDIGIPAKFGNATSPALKVDQGATGTTRPDRLIVAGHNWSGFTLEVKWSTDNWSTSTVADSWTQPDGSTINRPFTTPAGVKRYWGIFISGNGSAVPETTEVFLGPTYEFERDPSYGSLVRGLVDGVNRRDLFGGGVVYYDRWSARQKRYRKWPLPSTPSAMAANVRALDAAWAGRRAFFVEDDDGSWFFAELLRRAEETARLANSSAFEVEVLEVLP